VDALVAELRAVGAAAGLDVVRVAEAAPFESTCRDIEQRKAAGLHGGMAFTYGKPQRSTTPAWALPGARTLVVGARAYGRRPGAGPVRDAEAGHGVRQRPDRPTGRIARSAVGDEYALLRAGLQCIARRLKEDGYRTRVLADDNTLVDRAAAYRAGIGWWGKNTLVIVPGAGSWFVLGSVLTDAALPADPGPVEDHCGPCTRCMPACPTGALIAPGVLDARLCLSWVLEAPGAIPRELRVAAGDRIYGCDACQEACPPNRAAGLRAARTGDEPPPAGLAPGRVDLLEMLAASDAELLARFGHFYLAGRNPALLRRNALVALGNSADGHAAGVAAALAAALQSGDPMIRSHAVWACRRLDRPDLLEELRRSETDPLVVDELLAGG
jgi:epoxyqueuosine reductase